MSTTDLDTEEQRITDELGAARSRLEDLTERRAHAQERLEALQAERAATVAVVDPEDKGAGQRRRQLRDAEDLVADYDGAIKAAQARIGDLVAEEARLARKTRAITARAEIEAHLALAAEVDALWRPMQAKLHELLESAADIAALVEPLVGQRHIIDRAPESFVGNLLYRLDAALGHLDATRLSFALRDRSSHVALREREAARIQRALQAVDNILNEEEEGR